MKEIFNHYNYPIVKDNTIIITKKLSVGSSISFFSTPEDAKNALEFARFCQYAGIALRIDRKIMIKK